ncbi:redoxin domain-containing protein [Bhargavaea beijingensis]|uniref:Peroxiredoxin n=1 Tax=Bhargavaea beijingensis TaxID=426756 RepID=A0A1G7BT12_9BACL|nr:redoxin domain-containing protein [Bhargavaea beijingensis]MCW1926698.1 redoxin domain-containing protein [Bhargavaea beijingensis]RSK37048.1 redoxin domain-containing protein [Bhargavaea beijingensis]SDE30248.1 Peroxiredoxin [Bhargavaea beijingensis]
MNKKWFGSIIALAVIAAMVGIMLKNTANDGFSGQKKQLERELTQSETQEEADSGTGAMPGEGIAKGEAAPDFTLETLDGEKLTLSDLRGEKVILNFWASWCGPCRAEMPHMQEYYEKEAEKAGVRVIAVNLSTSERGDKETVMENIQAFVDEFGLSFPIPLDTEGEQMDVYRVITIPTTYIIDTSGIIRHVVRGPMDAEMMRNLTGSID